MQKSFQYHSTHIAYTIQGSGTPVVLLHGFGEDSRIWNEQVSFLQNHCMLIVPDLPGSGKSSLLRLDTEIRSLEFATEPTSDSSLQTPDYISIDDYADTIHALLQQENISSCIMLGHSMGGYITLAFAEKFPTMLTGFGLVHSTAFADSEEKKKNREKSIDLIEQYGPHPFLKNTIPNLFGKLFKEIHPEKVDQLTNDAKAFTKAALQQYCLAMMHRPDRTHVLKSNYLPVLFVIGTEDIAAPMEDVLKQVSLPNISYIYILPGIGHMGMWESAEKLNRQLLAFINP